MSLNDLHMALVDLDDAMNADVGDFDEIHEKVKEALALVEALV